MGVQHHPVSAQPGPAWPEMWHSGGGAGRAGRAGSLILMGSAHGTVIHITRWPHSGDCAPNEVPDPVSVAWAPGLGHRHHYPGNRVLGALGPPPHCLTPLVPPPFSSVRGQISDRLCLPLPDTTCRIHSVSEESSLWIKNRGELLPGGAASCLVLPGGLPWPCFSWLREGRTPPRNRVNFKNFTSFTRPSPASSL